MDYWFEGPLDLWKTCGEITVIYTEYLYLEVLPTIADGFLQVFHNVFHRIV